MEELDIDYRHILAGDIETSRIKVDQDTDDVQVTYLTNTLEIDIETGEIIEKHDPNGQGVFHRTIQDWIIYLNEISKHNKRIVYCHNLFYEMSFIMKTMNASIIEKDGKTKLNQYQLPELDGIMRSSTSVIYAVLDCCPNIIFRDSLALFNSTVKKLGDDLNKRYGIKDFPKDPLQDNTFRKLDGDYDYSVRRLPWDDLELLDYKYNERDNLIVLKSLYHFLKDRDLGMEECPLTATSDVKRARKKYIIDNHTVKHLQTINFNKYNSLNTYEFYETLRNTYQGGFTGANPNYIGKMVQDVYSADIKSSYPYQMVNHHFPQFTKKNTRHYEGKEADDYFKECLEGLTHEDMQCGIYTRDKGYYATIELVNVRVRNENYLLDLSYSHCTDLSELDNFDSLELVNGKIKKASNIMLSVNAVDMKRLNDVYVYDEIYVYELWVTDISRRLPLGEINFIIENFLIKESIDKEKFPIDYNLSKAKINSMYGVKVQNEIKDHSYIENGEVKVIQFNKLGVADYGDLNLTQEEVFNNYVSARGKRVNPEGGNFDVYSDGVHITSFARTMLMGMMVKLVDEGYIPIYADTDSLKFIAKEKSDSMVSAHKITSRVNELIGYVNKCIINDNRNNVRCQDFISNIHNNSLFDGISKEKALKKLEKLGTWEIESVDEKGSVKPYSYFKTLGAKKYAYVDHEGLHTTVAGCNKKNFRDAITKYANNENIELHVAMNEIFKAGTLVSEKASGRTIAAHEKRPFEEVSKLTADGIPLECGGGTVISDTTYLLNISKLDEIFVDYAEREDEYVRKIDENGVLTFNVKGETSVFTEIVSENMECRKKESVNKTVVNTLNKNEVIVDSDEDIFEGKTLNDLNKIDNILKMKLKSVKDSGHGKVVTKRAM